MVVDCKTLAKECYESGDYNKYVEITKKQYEEARTPEDLEEYEKAKKFLELYNDIQEIIKMNGKSCYEILGVKQSATLEEIKKTFRTKASRYHPNRAPIKGAQDAFRILQEAYFEINTDEKREAYDAKQKSKNSFFTPQHYNSYRRPAGGAYPFGNAYFYVSTNTTSGHWPFGLNENEISNIYTHLYRRRYTRPNSQSRDSPSIYISLFLVLLFVLLNIIS
ncbi:hypothetical protein GINT2_001001 [Glugoides intestinalis]